MNPGILEQGGDVAKSLVDSFKGNPIVLSMVMMNFLLVGYIYYQGIATNSQRREAISMYITQVSEFQQLLSKCVVPNKDAGLQQPRLGSLDHLLPK